MPKQNRGKSYVSDAVGNEDAVFNCSNCRKGLHRLTHPLPILTFKLGVEVSHDKNGNVVFEPAIWSVGLLDKFTAENDGEPITEFVSQTKIKLCVGSSPK